MSVGSRLIYYVEVAAAVFLSSEVASKRFVFVRLFAFTTAGVLCCLATIKRLPVFYYSVYYTSIL